MKRLCVILLAAALLSALSACGKTTVPAETEKGNAAPQSAESAVTASAQNPGQTSSGEAPVQADKAEKEASYPFEDADGRVHHLIYLNDELVETEHDAYTYPAEPKGAYYPIAEVLEQFGVECLYDESAGMLKTRLNGQTITCKTDSTDIVVGKTTLGGTAPEIVDGCLFVPSYTFMQLMDAVVDFTSDRSGVTIDTGMKIDKKNSGTDGLSLSEGTAGSLGKVLHTGNAACSCCGGTGRAICTSCYGTGGTTQYIQARDPISGQYTIQSRRAFCSRCGGSGRVACPLCGGSGSR